MKPRVAAIGLPDDIVEYRHVVMASRAGRAPFPRARYKTQSEALEKLKLLEAKGNPHIKYWYEEIDYFSLTKEEQFR